MLSTGASVILLVFITNELPTVNQGCKLHFRKNDKRGSLHIRCICTDTVLELELNVKALQCVWFQVNFLEIPVTNVNGVFFEVM